MLYGKLNTTESIGKVYIGDVIYSSILNFRPLLKRLDAEYLKERAEKLTLYVGNYKNTVKLTYVSSNLGKGFIFYFVCCRCGRRSRYLYSTLSSSHLCCRRCHHLNYQSQRVSDKRVSKLLKDTTLLSQCLESPKFSDQLVAMRAYLIIEKEHNRYLSELSRE